MLSCCLNTFIMLWIVVLDILNISTNLYCETPSRSFFMITCFLWVAKPLSSMSYQHKYWWRHQQYCDVTILFDLWPKLLASMTCTEVQRARLKSPPPPLITSTNSRKRTWSRDFSWSTIAALLKRIWGTLEAETSFGSPGLPLEVLLERDWSWRLLKEAPDFILERDWSANEAGDFLEAGTAFSAGMKLGTVIDGDQ